MTVTSTNDQITRIFNAARPHLPGAIDEAMQFEFFNVLDEFLDETSAWKEDIDIAVGPSSDTYNFLVPFGGRPVRLVGVSNQDNIPVAGTMYIPGVVVLRNTPQATQTLTLNVICNIIDPVKRDGFPQAPEFIFINYYPALLEGLLTKMMMQPAKPYTNGVLGAMHGQKFMSMKAVIRGQITQANLQGGQNWRYPRVGGF